MRSSGVYYGLVLLTVEKIIQHIFVTLAFYFNWQDISSTVVVSSRVLMITGAFIAILFALSLWGLLKKYTWSVNLLITLAIFDMVGELVAQGKVAITLNVSFLVAVTLFILCLVYRRQMQAA